MIYRPNTASYMHYCPYIIWDCLFHHLPLLFLTVVLFFFLLYLPCSYDIHVFISPWPDFLYTYVQLPFLQLTSNNTHTKRLPRENRASKPIFFSSKTSFAGDLFEEKSFWSSERGRSSGCAQQRHMKHAQKQAFFHRSVSRNTDNNNETNNYPESFIVVQNTFVAIQICRNLS